MAQYPHNQKRTTTRSTAPTKMSGAKSKRVNHRSGVMDAHVADRRLHAQARQAQWTELSPQEQINALDQRLGVDKGAEKQRTRLATIIRDGG